MLLVSKYSIGMSESEIMVWHGGLDVLSRGSVGSTHFQKNADVVFACSVHCADICTNGVKAAVCKTNLPIPQHT